MRIKETVERLQLDADRTREELARLRAEVEALKAGAGKAEPAQAADGAAKTVRKRTAKKTAEAAEE